MFLTIALILSLFVGCNNVDNNTISQTNGVNTTPCIVASPSLQQSNAPMQTDINTSVNSNSNLLIVSFIDVGQGDSILIQTPNCKNILIDAGESFAEGVVYNYLKVKNINKIDVLIATHPHTDHIGGMAFIINNFDIGSIYMPKASTTKQEYEDLIRAIKNKGLSIITAKAGVTIDLDSSITINMVAPISKSYDDLNDYSAVIKITYKNNSFLFAGDASNISEQEILDSGVNIKADVLKVGHHGSSTSSSAAFLNAVSPKYAIISVGKDNIDGNNKQETLDRLNSVGAKVYRTDESGTIIVTSDGKNIAINNVVSNYNFQAPPTIIHPEVT